MKRILLVIGFLLLASPVVAQGLPVFPMGNASVQGFLGLSSATFTSGGTSCANATLLTASRNTINDSTANQYFKLPAVPTIANSDIQVSVLDSQGTTELICPNTTGGNINSNGAGVAVGVVNAANFHTQGSDVWTVSP